MTQNLTVSLATGTLNLSLEPGTIPIHRLLGFAARISSKRKFLLVSKVLGKHYPVSPKLMAWSYRALARQIVGDLGASVWIGMAETATGLGYGVFEAAYRLGLQDGLFLQTTRYHLEGAQRLEFDEAHSHATDFFLYYPEQSELRQAFLAAQTLVLIDDEISTGRTFLQLIRAYRQANPRLRQVYVVSLVNFASIADRERFAELAGVAVRWVCLRQGRLEFIDGNNAELDHIHVNVDGNGACKRHLLGWPGRLGLAQPLRLAEDGLARLMALLPTGDPRPVLVLGSGECNAPAFLLGRALEQRGWPVKVQSTTRSPIHIGNDIRSVWRFEDNYEDGIPNFLYNMATSDYSAILLCHETRANAAIRGRLAEWGAIGVRIQTHEKKQIIFGC